MFLKTYRLDFTPEYFLYLYQQPELLSASSLLNYAKDILKKETYMNFRVVVLTNICKILYEVKLFL